MDNDLLDMPVRVTDRRWMADKSWRVYLELPADRPMLPVILTRLIETLVNATIVSGELTIEINPAFIRNVISKSKKFILVLETHTESQNAKVGPYVTSILHADSKLSITEIAPSPIKEALSLPTSNEEKKLALLGLHRFFQLPKFHRFIELHLASEFSAKIVDADICKKYFKLYCDVQSCRELSVETITDWRIRFNHWLSTGEL